MIIEKDHTDCVFCKIAKGEFPASLVYEDSKILIFPTLEPVNPGHMLIIPKVHAMYMSDLDPEITGYIMKMAARLASAIRKSKYKCEGINVFLADGEAAGQEVFHFHLHIYPRFKGDGFGFKYDKAKHYIRMNRTELDDIAGEIRAYFLRDTKEEKYGN